MLIASFTWPDAFVLLGLMGLGAYGVHIVYLMVLLDSISGHPGPPTPTRHEWEITPAEIDSIGTVNRGLNTEDQA